MTSPRQGDLFGSDDVSEERETPTFYPDPDEVRVELHRIPAKARAANGLGRVPRQRRFYKCALCVC